MSNLLERILSTLTKKATGKTYRAAGYTIALAVYVVSGVFCGYSLSNAQMNADNVMLEETAVETMAFAGEKALDSKKSIAVSRMILPEIQMTDDASEKKSSLLTGLDFLNAKGQEQDAADIEKMLFAGLDDLYKGSKEEMLTADAGDEAADKSLTVPKEVPACRETKELVSALGASDDTDSYLAAQKIRSESKDSSADLTPDPVRVSGSIGEPASSAAADTAVIEAFVTNTVLEEAYGADAGEDWAKPEAVTEPVTSPEPEETAILEENPDPEETAATQESQGIEGANPGDSTALPEAPARNDLTAPLQGQTTLPADAGNQPVSTVSGDSIAMPAPSTVPAQVSEIPAPVEASEPVWQTLSEEFSPEFEALCRIVQAEAGGEDTMGKILVANVVLNRVASPHYPSSIREVVFQSGQFSPIRDGSFSRANVSPGTIEAVQRALVGENYAQGALFFNSGSRLNRTMVLQHGGHRFYI